MSEKEAIKFIFAVAEEVKRSYEVPVILCTMSDYGDKIFNVLVDIRRALIMKSPAARFAAIINNIHVQWLEAVTEVESFKTRIYSVPQDLFLKAIEYTVKCVLDRFKYFKQYVKHIDVKMNVIERNKLHTELEIAADMCSSVVSVLKGKQKCFEQKSDKNEYNILANDEINELLFWIDSLTDGVVIQFKHAIVTTPDLLKHLAKISYDLVGKVADSIYTDEIKSLEGIHRVKTTHDLEILKLEEKVKVINDKITEIKTENPEQVLELKRLHFKADYINERLHTLKSIKASLNILGESTIFPSDDDILENKVRIFKHMLPPKNRYRLVEKLLKVWMTAFHGDKSSSHKSIVCILSPTEMSEMYSDDIGNFIVDQYSRKLYLLPEDERFYQLNENSVLVLVNDDDHIYFYDSCGRYYLEDETNTRIYKAHRTASEYVLHDNGKLSKVREEKDGILYYFDDIGRYRLDEDKLKVYNNEDSLSEYEDDGLGNLVRKRSEFPTFETCPADTTYTEESKYLKQAVGAALTKCIAETIMRQPQDPISFLADSLERYQRNKEEKQKQNNEEMAMFEERKMHKSETTIVSSVASEVLQECESNSYFDYNQHHYKSPKL